MDQPARFQRRKLDRLLSADDLSRHEVVTALRRVNGLRAWIREDAAEADPRLHSLGDIVGSMGMSWTRQSVLRFFRHIECTSTR